MIDASEILLDIEKEFQLFDLEIRGFRVWWMSRYKIYEKIHSAINATNKPIDKVNNDSKLEKYLSNFKYLNSIKLIKNKYSKADILCVSGTTLRRKILNNKSFDIIFDFIGKYDKDNSYAILNTLSGNGFKKNCYTSKCYNMSNLTLKNHIAKIMYKLKLTKNEIIYIVEKFKEVAEYLKNKYRINLNLWKVVCEQTCILLSEYKTACKIITKINPKVLYVECAYSPTHLLFIYAAKELNIPIVEFQHGLISEKHIAYIYNEKTYNADPVPDYICVYGSYFEKLIKEMNPNLNINIIKYGYPLLYEEVLEKHNDVREVKSKYTYLITTQGEGYSNYWVKFIKELLALDNKAKILLKVHPNEMIIYKQLYKEILENSRVAVSGNENIYDCLKKSMIHLSCFSTCHYESLVYDVPTYVIKFPGWKHVKRLKEYNVKYFKSARELVEYLNLNQEENILFDKFKKDFFDIEVEDIKLGKIKKSIVETNNLFTNK